MARCSSSLYQQHTLSDWTTIPRQGKRLWCGFRNGLRILAGRRHIRLDFGTAARTVHFQKEAQHTLFAFDIFRIVGARIYETRSFSFTGTSSRRHHRQRMLLTLVVISSARRPATRVRYKEEKNPSAALPRAVFVAFTLPSLSVTGGPGCFVFLFLSMTILGQGSAPWGGEGTQKSGGETSPRCRPPTGTSMEGR